MRKAVFVVALAVAAGPALADFPEKDITLIVPYGAGGGTDTAARLIQPHLEEILDTSLIVTNMPGAGGTVGATNFASSRTDGYTLAFLPAGTTVLQPHLRRLDYDDESFTPICMTIQDPVALMVGPDSPYDSVDALIAAAKETTLTAAGAAPGSFSHIGQLLLGRAHDVKFRYVPHDGGAAAARSVLGGQVDLVTDNANLVQKFGLKPLALMAETSGEGVADMPTMGDLGGDAIDLSIWYGLFAPAGTPDEVVERLSAACEEATSRDTYKQSVRDAGSVASYKNAADFDTFFHDEYRKNADLFEEIGLKN